MNLEGFTKNWKWSSPAPFFFVRTPDNAVKSVRHDHGCFVPAVRLCVLAAWR
jgi:hypothetical protein